MVTLTPREGNDATARRDAVVRLAAATRAVADAVAMTAVDIGLMQDATDTLEAIAHRLMSQVEEDAYSGLVIPPTDPAVPESLMPLNPIIGHCSPVRPDVSIRCIDGEVRGFATFIRRFVGPPGHAHGGISAMLADQLAAAAPMALGLRTVTKSLTVNYLRALPLNVEVELAAVCETDGDTYNSRFEVRSGGKIAVTGTAELVPYEAFAKRNIR
ncbi:MAG TPA: PaaI family thioesterase [Frankiaceae bacterium]|jgi:acyl-coenzyme A thioesterase PaaI-like protein|nr:PaaI family thioesterase [Frankiaceae bacterium]